MIQVSASAYRTNARPSVLQSLQLAGAFSFNQAAFPHEFAPAVDTVLLWIERQGDWRSKSRSCPPVKPELTHVVLCRIMNALHCSIPISYQSEYYFIMNLDPTTDRCVHLFRAPARPVGRTTEEQVAEQEALRRILHNASE